eukprot:TRINITY_DN393_c0_g1_i1.p1 TRINITY_DN393_c0_g1~~TRINITY_DN393_c0_g1_i1.p1  ORF type:complete len:281 (-),score=95.33 TRINITY_DN393_c0_g1_i1:350-1192(-)
MVKKRAGKASLNPTDSFRKAQRKRELKKNKKQRTKVRDVASLLKDPHRLQNEIDKLNDLDRIGQLDPNLRRKKMRLQSALEGIRAKQAQAIAATTALALQRRQQIEESRGMSIGNEAISMNSEGIAVNSEGVPLPPSINETEETTTNLEENGSENTVTDSTSINPEGMPSLEAPTSSSKPLSLEVPKSSAPIAISAQVLSMRPSSLSIRRKPVVKKRRPIKPKKENNSDPFGIAMLNVPGPRVTAHVPEEPKKKKAAIQKSATNEYDDFMKELEGIGAFE